MVSEFDAPAGPPPPTDLPAGWLARWNPKYETWFYVNKYTKKSQWEKPTAPCYPPDDELDDAPSGPPPAYVAGSKPYPPSSDAKPNPFNTQANNTMSEDERLARQLQAEEDARVRAPSRSPAPPMGAAASYSSTPLPAASPSYPDQLPPREEDRSHSRGLLGKLFGSGSKPRPQYGQPHYGAQPQYGQSQQYGGYPPPQQGYYGQPQQAYYGGGSSGYGGGGGFAQQQRPQRSGLGTAGGAALGLGAGLVGGLLLEDAIDHHDQQIYDQGFQNGENFGDNNGGGFDNGGGGFDDGGFDGGDGGDFGGGDF